MDLKSYRSQKRHTTNMDIVESPAASCSSAIILNASMGTLSASAKPPNTTKFSIKKQKVLVQDQSGRGFAAGARVALAVLVVGSLSVVGSTFAICRYRAVTR